MNRIIITAIISLSSYLGFGQLSITISSKEIKKFNHNTETYDSYSKAVFDNSIFILNKNEDVLLHKTSEYNRTYYLTFSNNDDDIYTYNAIDDSGVEWIILFDFKKNLLKLMLTSDDGIFLILYEIKSVF